MKCMIQKGHGVFGAKHSALSAKSQNVGAQKSIITTGVFFCGQVPEMVSWAKRLPIFGQLKERSFGNTKSHSRAAHFSHGLL